MKIRRHIFFAISLLVMIPVCFFILVIFSGLFDNIARETAIRTTVKSIYKSFDNDNWNDFKIDSRTQKIFNLHIILYDEEHKILFSNIDNKTCGDYITSEFLKSFKESEYKDYLITIWSLKEVENTFKNMLINEEQYGKYNINAIFLWKQIPLFMIKPFTRTVLIIALFFLMTIGAILITVIVIWFLNMFSSLKKLTKDYSQGDYSRELPLKGGKDEKSVICVINKMVGQIKTHEKQRTHIIMGLSHDFKTPLTLIKGYTEVIEMQNKDNATIEKSCKIINGKVEQLENMVNELTEFAALEEGDYPIKKTRINLKEVLNDFASQAMNDALVYNKEVIPEINIPDTYIEADIKLMERAFTNLIHNAFRYTGPDGVIKITASHLKGKTHVSIEDNGQGISDKDKPYIFDMFYRASKTRNEGGMGIGLSVVKDIVDAHSWSIKVTNGKPKGAVFTIIMPS